MTTGLLNDKEITRLADEGMITPFVPELIRWVDAFKVISYGVSSYGYDLRLSAKEFKVFRHIPGTIVNPKAFNNVRSATTIVLVSIRGRVKRSS